MKLNLNTSGVPAILKDVPQWLCWRKELRDGKETKVPYQVNGQYAKTNDAATWTDYKTAELALNNGAVFDGIGFVLTQQDPFVGIDLDHCRCPAFVDVILPWAREIIGGISSYTEASPSGHGIRIFVKNVTLPPKGRKKGDIEIYESGRYLTVTGHRIQGTPPDIQERTDAVLALHRKIFDDKGLDKTPEVMTRFCESIEARLQQAFASKTGDKIKPLYEGVWTDYPSQSEADLALCSHLAFWLNNDPALIDAAFRSSGLFREKWNRKHFSDGQTYGQATIVRAIESTGETYQINQGGKSYRQIAELLKEGETGYATWVTRELKGKLRFDINENRWFQFDRHTWKKIPDEAALEACGVIKDVLKEMAIRFARKRIEAGSGGDTSSAKEVEKREKTLLKAIREIGELYTQKAVMHICRSDRSYLGFNGQWDEDPYLVAAPNGILNLKDMTFRDGKPEDNIRTVIPTPWEGMNVPCPLWGKTLLEIFDENPDVVDYLHRVFGYCLTGLTRHHHLWIFEGKGRNGKSLLYKILKYVLGDLIGILDRELLLDKKHHRQSGSATPDVLNLRGKRIGFIIETSEGRKFDAGKLKLLSGGDLLHGRGLYAKDYSTFENTAKLFVMTNSRPHISGGDYASWQRIILFPFNISFVPEPDLDPKKKERLADPDLEEELKTEAPGILAWLVNGYVMARDQGLIPPRCIKEATNEYRNEEDTIGRFVEEKLERYEGDEVQAKDIYQAYRSWCEDQGIHSPKHNTTFGRELKGHFESILRGSKTFYLNVRLKG
ncbi:MAG: phage/plasmid primase, P4 family [Syntrophales bacterium]|jgi:putative DNA primase/helicase